MGSIWKSQVLPRFANVFGNSKKKTAAAEAVKSFDESKEEYGKEFEEKKTELEPKVVEIYEASSAPIKVLVKKPTESGVKKNSSGVKKFLEELVKIEFPGSKPVSEAAGTLGPAYVAGPIAFIFQEISSLLPAEEPPAAPSEAAAAAAALAEERASKEVTAEVIEETKEEEEEEEAVKVDETTAPPPSAKETPAPVESTTTEPPPPPAEEAPAPEPAKA